MYISFAPSTAPHAPPAVYKSTHNTCVLVHTHALEYLPLRPAPPFLRSNLHLFVAATLATLPPISISKDYQSSLFLHSIYRSFYLSTELASTARAAVIGTASLIDTCIPNY